MGFIDKLKGFVNPSGMEDYNEYDDGEFFSDEEENAEERTQVSHMDYQQKPSAPQTISQQAGPSMSLGANALELKVVRPERFQNVTQIADHLLNRRTVVLNLEMTNKETSRRIIDFLTGVAYSIGGQLKNVANNTYVITPSNIDVSNDVAAEAAGEVGGERPAEEGTGEYYNGI